MAKRPTTALRELFAAPGVIVAPGVADACGLPVISDADTGYGNPLNVQRTVRTFEKAGVVGMSDVKALEERYGLPEEKRARY